ncbi:helix-turn-helix domain-containing protein [Rhizobium helianthi]|uniref:Helix-turn-helix domain-containing protein n=1 Tax=Rhizobium helianthi TaxID=1132695 RepID=A0ABW4M0S6_9HYPH
MGKPQMFLGSRLRNLRQERGLTQAQMANELSLSPSYIALMEQNQRPITEDVLIRLERVYDVAFPRFGLSTDIDMASRVQHVLKDPIGRL